MEEPELSSQIRNFLEPTPLANFHVPFTTPFPVVYIHHSETGEPEEVELDEMFPFQTIQDIKTFLYIKKEKQEEYHPAYQALLIHEGSSPDESYIPADFAFVNVDKKGRVLKTHSLANPFARIKGPVDERFVDDKGDRKIVKITDRSTTTMEDVFPQLFGQQRPILHLFLFSDVVSSVDMASLQTNREWNGRIYPYFPQLPMNYDTELQSSNQVRFLEARVTYVQTTLDMMEQLNAILESGTDPLKPFQMVSVKFLRLVWKTPFREVPDVETLFYQMPATYTFPFLRILPFQGVPIAKLFVESPLRIPSFDPRLIEQWAEQKAPSKDDFLFGKVMIRDKQGPEPALFGTLRIFDDRSADFILQPPQGLKRLTILDINRFPEYLESALKNSYLQASGVEIGEAHIVCAIRGTGLKQISKANFLKRLQAFKPLFLEIPPLPNETPVAMLRYRGVSKFTAEDKIFTFITQYNSRKVAGGAVGSELADEIVQALMDTFQLTFDQANLNFTKWLSESGKITLNIAETKDYVLQYNRGIDIAVFADQSSYTFHLYRVESALHLQRILTALSLVLSASEENLPIPAEAADFEDAASVVDEETAEREADEHPAEGTPNAVDFAGLADLGEEVDDLQETNLPPKPLAKPIPEPVTVAKPKPTLETLDKFKIREFFTKKLYDTDPELFPRTKTTGSAKASEQSYSIKCQSTDDRQPIVMTSDKYEAMLTEYEEDDVTFLEFPLRGNEPVSTGLIVPVLLYGSGPSAMNYYICCEYFCLRDYIMVLKKDFEGTSFRPKKLGKDGVEILKEPNTCPFCQGKLITNKKEPGPNETVYKRKDNNKNKFIGLLKQQVHEISQPCCFGKLPKYRMTDPQFAHLHYRERTEEEQEEEEERGTTMSTLQDEMDYSVAILRAHKKYIVEKLKFPLGISGQGGPQVGLLLPILDPYFQQDDSKLIHTAQQKQELLINSKGFLRIGVDNSQLGKADSFFAAVAPYFQFNSANDVRRQILRVLHPRNFLFFNYGNLVLEFYNPSDAGPTRSALSLWSSKHLEAELKESNEDAILRLWKSYHRFLEFVESRTTLKEYRQFAQMLATPGFFSARGVVFVVLDIVKEGEGEKLEVRCPPFGYDNEQYGDCDIAFILHHYSGVWEPLFYSENQSAKGIFSEKHDAILTFQRSLFHLWPSVVQKRVAEFTTACSGPGRAAWTSGTAVDSFSLIPLSRAIQGMGQAPEGVVRDVYNHIVALTFRAEAGRDKLVALPVVDDGTIVTPMRVYFDWNDFSPASFDAILDFYEIYVKDTFSYYPGYTIRRAVHEIATDKLVAAQLANGLFLPCEVMKMDDPSVSAFLQTQGSIEIENVKDMEWSINREILFGKAGVQNNLQMLKSTEDLVNEGFEYLRLMFSNWFSSEKVSGELRSQVEEILFAKQIPLFEKRKRLEILLGPTLLQWMDTEEEFKDEQKSLLRADCRLATGPQCPGQCVWKESESKCLLHVPGETEVFANVPQILMRRLFDELLRFPERRQQLLEKKVSPLVSIKQAIVIKDQYIVPQSSLAWFDLLRADWVKPATEQKKFFEEMSRDVGKAPLVEVKKENAEVAALPELLVTRLGEDDESKGYYLYRPPAGDSVPGILPFMVSAGTFPSELGLDDDVFELTEDAMRQFVLEKRKPILQIDLTGGDINHKAFKPAKRLKDPNPLILVLQDIDQGGPAMLSLSPTKPIPIPKDKLSSGLEFMLDEAIPVSG